MKRYSVISGNLILSHDISLKLSSSQFSLTSEVEWKQKDVSRTHPGTKNNTQRSYHNQDLLLTSIIQRLEKFKQTLQLGSPLCSTTI